MSVHGLSSSQTTAEPPHAPAEQASPEVHASPSSHAATLGTEAHPKSASHVSSVHALWSSQNICTPDTHRPAEQVSPIVHALPSSQGCVLGTLPQPCNASHVFVVQGLSSSQLTGLPTQLPPVHASSSVHALSSSQGAMPHANSHPALVQVSSVHGLPSSHTIGLPTHSPARQLSPMVHASPSSHAPCLGWFSQPLAPQASAVHALPSSQPPGQPHSGTSSPQKKWNHGFFLVLSFGFAALSVATYVCSAP